MRQEMRQMFFDGPDGGILTSPEFIENITPLPDVDERSVSRLWLSQCIGPQAATVWGTVRGLAAQLGVVCSEHEEEATCPKTRTDD